MPDNKGRILTEPNPGKPRMSERPGKIGVKPDSKKACLRQSEI
jgi:hypothetical protein